MKGEDTKKIIVKKALELFSERGYDAVSVGDIAKAVGIKAPSLYNHFESKQAIFKAIVEETSVRYESGTDEINVHVQNVKRDIPSLTGITEEELFNKLLAVFEFSSHDETVRRFRKMMTIEQFRSTELAGLYSYRFVERLVAYHAEIFKKLIAAGEIAENDPEALSMIYIAPVITLLGVCDRQPEREDECIKKLKAHVNLFFNAFNVIRGNKQ